MEEWRDIPGFKNYQASTLGNIRSRDRFVQNHSVMEWREGRILKKSPNRNRRNYEQVTLSVDGITKIHKVHRLIALTYPDICGEMFPGCEIDHINGITTDNRPENLRVTDKKGNMNNPITKLNCSRSWDDERRKKCSERMKENNPSKQEGYWTVERRNLVGKRNSLKRKPVNQYSLDGVFIRQWESLSATIEAGYSPSNISSCIRGKQKTSYNSLWKYA